MCLRFADTDFEACEALRFFEQKLCVFWTKSVNQREHRETRMRHRRKIKGRSVSAESVEIASC
jgi:hypothetical protein